MKTLSNVQKIFFSVVAVCLLFAAPVKPVQAAGIPVIDASALAQDAANFMQQMTEMANQLNTMKSQLDQQVQQYKSLVGDRGMGQLLDGQIRNYIPEDWKDALAVLDKPSGYGQLSETMSEIMRANSVLENNDLAGIKPDTRRMIEEGRKTAAKHQALGQAAYKSASERMQALQTLQNKIGAATDPKAILDLQARIQSEQTQLQNEANKLQTLVQLQQSEELAREQKVREIIVKGAGKVENMPQVNL
jgi:type IV secretion system protein VirB5